MKDISKHAISCHIVSHHNKSYTSGHNITLPIALTHYTLIVGMHSKESIIKAQHT